MRHQNTFPIRLAVPALMLVAGACGDRGGTVPADDVLIVTSAREDEVLFLDPSTGERAGSIPVDFRESVPEHAGGVAVGPGGDAWYLVLGQAEPALWLFSGTGPEPVQRIALPELRNASRTAVSPDGRWVAVTEYWLEEPTEPGHVAIVDLQANALGKTSPCPAPYGLAWEPQGRVLAVSCPTADLIVLLDGSTFAGQGAFVATSEDVPAGSTGNPATRPMGIAWSPAGDRIFAALYRERRLGIFTSDGLPMMQVDLDGNPVNLAVGDRGRYVAVVTRNDPTLTVVEVRTGEAMAMPLPDADSPHAVALSPDGRTAFVAYEGTESSPGGVLAVDMDAGEVLWTRETGPMTTGLAYRPASSSSTAASGR